MGRPLPGRRSLLCFSEPIAASGSESLNQKPHLELRIQFEPWLGLLKLRI